MGYDLTWADDPYEGERNALTEAIGRAILGPDMSPETFARVTNTIYRALEAHGGYFRTSDTMMLSLIAEMDAQGMFEDNEAMREKLDSQNGTITPEEIDRVFQRLGWPIAPLEPPAGGGRARVRPGAAGGRARRPRSRDLQRSRGNDEPPPDRVGDEVGRLDLVPVRRSRARRHRRRLSGIGNV